jgi:hypothetical protein
MNNVNSLSSVVSFPAIEIILNTITLYQFIIINTNIYYNIIMIYILILDC